MLWLDARTAKPFTLQKRGHVQAAFHDVYSER